MYKSKIILALVLRLRLGANHFMELLLRPPAAHHVIDVFGIVVGHSDVASVDEVQGQLQRVEPEATGQLDSLAWGGGVDQLLHLGADPGDDHGVHPQRPALPTHEFTHRADLQVWFTKICWEVCRTVIDEGGGVHVEIWKIERLITELLALDYVDLVLVGPGVSTLHQVVSACKWNELILNFMGESTYRMILS